MRDALARGLNFAKQPITDEERAGYESDLRLIESYLTDAPGGTLDEVRKSIDLTTWPDRFAGNSQLKRSLFANYVAGTAVASAYRAR